LAAAEGFGEYEVCRSRNKLNIGSNYFSLSASDYSCGVAAGNRAADAKTGLREKVLFPG
jgi:hypothetical protein